MGTPRPKYEQIKAELRAEVASEQYEPGSPFITQNQVRARFGVSSTTAVRALNDLVNEGLLVRHRGRGTFVADRTAAPAAERQRTGAVACVLGSHGPHQTALLRGLESGCVERGMRLHYADHEGSVARQAQALRQAVEDDVNGVVLYPVEGPPDVALIEELRQHRMPLVLVDRYFPDLPLDVVTADNFTVGHWLTEQLISFGHRRIATLWGETDCTSVRDRMSGHQQALRAHGLPILPRLTALRSFNNLSDHERRALLQSLLESDQPPTAFLCSQGFIVATVAADLATLGVSVPDDVDLAGMDDAGPYDVLPLTTVAAALPSRDMGVRAMELLATRMAERAAGEDPYRSAEQVVLPVAFRTRESAAVRLRTVAARQS
ncbi:hypothetical protein AQ490_05600 [Wenjunlia vitaminophila]|uniref:HTH gntR-type domain-containing protein n=1 Tax=Wenjunlia vitaminophila TaxID=76728 RepID=A0A0T6LPU7_WENVI|nr:GntR family transcriptional regulator [Wenjunlia vitaminophila]KRV47836.1 hypothetical protein AQ490_05600 [Wenjunlia vitaminophila]